VCVCVLAVGVLIAGNASAALFIVDSVQDEVDDNTADSICHTASGKCTLRAATMQANKVVGEGVTIKLPSGTYQLTIPAIIANDGDSNGDLALDGPSAAIRRSPSRRECWRRRSSMRARSAAF
jgi:hypothetical protein